jgi:predicted trehalose synthase
MPRHAATRWRRIRGAFQPHGVHWEPTASGGTNSCWKGTGSSSQWFLKWYKTPYPGLHPEVEIAQYLQSKNYPHTPRFGGALERCFDGKPSETVAVVLSWEFGQSAWDRLLEDFRASKLPLHDAALWGRQLARLHRVLSSGSPGSGFEPLVDTDYPRTCGERIRFIENQLSIAFASPPPDGADPSVWESARAAWPQHQEKSEHILHALTGSLHPITLSRIHGDLHLGQILDRGEAGWMFTDFEGEPLRQVEARRRPDCPLRDVAGMWRSFAYASTAARASDSTRDSLQQCFLESWLSEAPNLPTNWRPLLNALIREKNLYEVWYELNHRPSWLHIPLRGL